MGLLTEQEQLIADDLLAANFQADDIPALMGNISVETGGTFDPFQQQEGGDGHGLFQFSGNHLKAYKKWLRAIGFPDSGYNQALFVNSNVYAKDTPYDLGWKARGLLQDAFSGDLSTQDKTRIFSDVYEKPGVPHMDRRIEESLRYEDLL